MAKISKRKFSSLKIEKASPAGGAPVPQLLENIGLKDAAIRRTLEEIDNLITI